MRQALVHHIRTQGPDDVAGLLGRIESGAIDPLSIKAILGKTEGNGCVNDFTRGFAVQSLRAALSPWLQTSALDQISMVMSGGTEGGLSPHILIFEIREVDNLPFEQGETAALALAVAHTPPMRPEMIGRRAQTLAVAEAVQAAMADAGIAEADDVHYVQVKCPLLTAARIDEAVARCQGVVTSDTLKSMGLSRGASALGVAIALGEVEEHVVTDQAIASDGSSYSNRASCSAGIELMQNEIVVMGNSRTWLGDLVIGHDVMTDAIDGEALYHVLEAVGIEATRQLDHHQRSKVKAVLAKAEAHPDGVIRGARHTMLDDSDISSTRHARAFIGGALASIVGDTALFVSGGAEHQGPPGGGPIAVIASRP